MAQSLICPDAVLEVIDAVMRGEIRLNAEVIVDELIRRGYKPDRVSIEPNGDDVTIDFVIDGWRLPRSPRPQSKARSPSETSRSDLEGFLAAHDAYFFAECC